MRPIDRAIEFVEQNLHREILLTDVAKHSHISKFYFSRVFAEATGYSLMQYVRGRRLTEAAKKLATGAPAILDLALEFGYDSHAAFTRAFKKHFGISPKECRGQADSIRRLYVEKIAMTEPTTITVYPPRIELDGPLMVVGLTARYS